jgi:hypothetical protein
MNTFISSISIEQLLDFYSEINFMDMNSNSKQFFHALDGKKLFQKISIDKLLRHQRNQETKKRKHFEISFFSLFYMIKESNHEKNIIEHLFHYFQTLGEDSEILKLFCKDLSMDGDAQLLILKDLEKNESLTRKILSSCKLEKESCEDFSLSLRLDLLKTKLSKIFPEGNSISKISKLIETKNQIELSKISFDEVLLLFKHVRL